jgi:hypothetical protein
MTNGVDRHDPNTPSSVDDDSMMDIESKKITSIADLCHPAKNDRNKANMGGNSGMDLLSQAAVALIDH